MLILMFMGAARTRFAFILGYFQFLLVYILYAFIFILLYFHQGNFIEWSSPLTGTRMDYYFL